MLVKKDNWRAQWNISHCSANKKYTWLCQFSFKGGTQTVLANAMFWWVCTQFSQNNNESRNINRVVICLPTNQIGRNHSAPSIVRSNSQIRGIYSHQSTAGLLLFAVGGRGLCLGWPLKKKLWICWDCFLELMGICKGTGENVAHLVSCYGTQMLGVKTN